MTLRPPILRFTKSEHKIIYLNLSKFSSLACNESQHWLLCTCSFVFMHVYTCAFVRFLCLFKYIFASVFENIANLSSCTKNYYRTSFRFFSWNFRLFEIPLNLNGLLKITINIDFPNFFNACMLFARIDVFQKYLVLVIPRWN